VLACLSILSVILLTGCGDGTLGPGVPPKSLVSIAVTPANPNVPLGALQQFTATGTYSDHSTQDLTNSATWASSDTTVASIVPGGMATALALGTSTISATSGTITGRTTMNVVPPKTLVSIAVTPANPDVVLGAVQQFTAIGTYSDNSTQDLTATATWASSNTTVASIVPGGLATALALGSTSISATSGTITGSTTMNVVAAKTLVSIAVTPANPNVTLATVQQFTATGTYSDGSTQDLTATATWVSSDTTVASIVPGGLATALALGASTISATSGTITGSTTMNVVPAVLASIKVRPAQKKIALLTSWQFTAIGTYTDGSTRNLTQQVTWSSSNTGVATITANGRAKSVAPGTTTIRATLGSISGSSTLDVSNATIVKITVTPAGRIIAPGTRLNFVAHGVFSDGTTQIITNDATWASDNVAVATMGGVSTATGVGPGTANISATFGGVSGQAPLIVSSATLVSISITPGSAVLAPTTAINLVATGTFSDGTTQLITNIVNWTSSAPGVADVTGGGRVTGLTPGGATITAQLGGLSSNCAIFVDGTPLTSIKISPPTASIPQQGIQDFVATGTFADGRTQDLTETVLWTSSPASVATISNVPGAAGEATGVAPGTATITALFGGQLGTATLTVTTAAATALRVLPESTSLEPGSFTRFTAVAEFSDGTTRDVTSSVTWTSSDATVAGITPKGVATPAASGMTTVTATMNHLSGTATMRVY